VSENRQARYDAQAIVAKWPAIWAPARVAAGLYHPAMLPPHGVVYISVVGGWLKHTTLRKMTELTSGERNTS